MKKISKVIFLILMIASIASVCCVSSAEEGKEYIVYPKQQTYSLRANENPGGFIVATEEELESLLEEGAVDWYEEDIEGEFFGTYDDIYTDYYSQLEYEMINAVEAWENGCFGQNIKVAVIDSGVNYHEEFEDRLLEGYDFHNGTEDVSDIVGHGTFVAGVVASASDGYGTRGVASESYIVPLKIDNKNGNPELSLACYAIYAAVDYFDCDVINMSCGFYDINGDGLLSLKRAIDYAVEKGVLVVASVGNYRVESDGNVVVNNSVCYPAGYENVIGVGSVNYETGDVSFFSVQNNSVSVVAPGEDIKGPIVWTEEDGTVVKGYTSGSGTSFSTPIVSSVLATLKNADPDMNQEEAMALLCETARDAGTEGYDVAYGHGIIDVKRAFEKVLNVAQYDAPKNVSFVVRAENSALNGAITVDGYIPGHIGSYPMNEKITVKACPAFSKENKNYKFAHWTNGNGTYVSGNAEFSFDANSNFTLEAVYDEKEETQQSEKKRAEFWNGNGVFLASAEAEESGIVPSENIPKASMTGYVFDSWKADDGSFFGENVPLSKSLTRVVAQFDEAEENVYTVKIHDSARVVSENGIYGSKVSYIAADESNFDYWKINDRIISYNPKLELTIWDNVDVYAEYNDDKELALPGVACFEKGDAKFIVYNTLPGYEILDAGIVFGFENMVPTVSKFCSKASVKKLSDFGQFTAKAGDLQSHTSYRGYLIYKNEYTGSIRVVYSD